MNAKTTVWSSSRLHSYWELAQHNDSRPWSFIWLRVCFWREHTPVLLQTVFTADFGCVCFAGASRRDQPSFTLRQVSYLCERLLKDHEEKIREEYEQILNTKLAGNKSLWRWSEICFSLLIAFIQVKQQHSVIIHKSFSVLSMLTTV